jgi:hypothetical protein
VAQGIGPEFKSQFCKKKKELCEQKTQLLLGFLGDRGLNSGFYTYKAGALLIESTCSPFCSHYFGGGVSQTLLGWHPTVILPISASQVARIIGVSHWHALLGIF